MTEALLWFVAAAAVTGAAAVAWELGARAFAAARRRRRARARWRRVGFLMARSVDRWRRP